MDQEGHARDNKEIDRGLEGWGGWSFYFPRFREGYILQRNIIVMELICRKCLHSWNDIHAEPFIDKDKCPKEGNHDWGVYSSKVIE